jgi:hypothetical protein
VSNSSISEQWRRAEDLWPTTPHGFIADDPYWTVNEDGSRTISLRPAPVPRPIPWWRRILRHFTPWWVVALSPLLVIPIGLAAAPAAEATPRQDTAYIRTLDQFRVPYTRADSAVELGQTVCAALDADADIVDVAVDIMVGSRGVYTVEDAGHIIGAAIGVYCSEHADLVIGKPPTLVSGGIGGVLR